MRASIGSRNCFHRRATLGPHSRAGSLGTADWLPVTYLHQHLRAPATHSQTARQRGCRGQIAAGGGPPLGPLSRFLLAVVEFITDKALMFCAAAAAAWSASISQRRPRCRTAGYACVMNARRANVCELSASRPVLAPSRGVEAERTQDICLL